MPEILGAITSRLVYKDRIETVKTTFATLREKSLFEAVRNQVDGFGHNNRKLIMG